MADFVAVIRRAVDGLSDNTPEMRARVYEKARGAVRRQLESMKPQPSDVMIGRQMDKLEAAIGEVENEHAEALPAITPEAEQEAATAVEPAEAFEQQHEEPAPEPEPEEAPVETVEEQSAPEEADDAAPEPEPVHEHAPEPEPELQAETETEPRDEPGTAEADDDAPEEPVEEGAAPETGEPVPLGFHAIEPQEQEPSGDADGFVPHDEAEENADPVHGDDAERVPEELELVSPQEERPFASYPGNEGIEAEPASGEPLPEDEPHAVSTGAPDDLLDPAGDTEANRDPFGDHAAGFSGENGSQATEPEAEPVWHWEDDGTVDAPASGDQPVSASMPQASDSWSWPVEKKNEPDFAAEPQTEKKPDGWDELEELIGYDRSKEAAVASATIADTAAAPPPPSFDAGEARSGSRLLPVLVIGGLLALLGGGGYAYWQERDTVNAWVSDIMASIMPAETPPVATDEPATDGADTAAPEAGSGESGTGVAAVDEAGAAKFTQRLLADGSETDPGPASLPAGDGTEEGTTVTAQTDGGTLAGDTAAAEAGNAAVTAPAEGGETASNQIPPGTGERMFLYEERLGQTSPTAIEGTVDWSSKEESPGGDARAEPVIQGQITVPDRGVTALMTIKRNADPSLPASHLIEFVFSMPESFEGGGIDSVQRVSMKRTEQDRGDPLIAVPAKITDDFHMVALNDFPEAIATNMDLLRNRNWIDIPITYRNGRRALLTLQKGTKGVEIFNSVMQSWGTAAGGSAANTGQ